MFEKDVESSLQTLGKTETKQGVQRWLLMALGLTVGEIVSCSVLAVALATLGREWPAPLLVVLGVVWHVGSVALAIVFFRRIKQELGRDHDPALPTWLLKGFGPFLFGPYLLLPFVAFSRNADDKGLWVACVLVLGSLSWFGALVFYMAALWFRNLFTESLEVLSQVQIETRELPSKVRAYLEDRGREFELLGFELVGDFRQKQVQRQFARIFLGADGKFVGEAVVNESHNLCSCCILSLLADGTYLESSDIKIDDSCPRAEKLVLQGGAGSNVAELLEHHGAMVQSECAARDTAPIAIEADHVELVSRYGALLSNDLLMERRILSANPYEPLSAQIKQGIQELLAAPVGV